MDREAVKDLVIAYGEFLEAGDYSEDAVSAVFTDGCVVEFAVGGTGTGVAEVAKKHSEMMASFVSAHHNITNVLVKPDGEDCATVTFHMEVLHEFKPEIAAHTPGNLFIVNDRIAAKACRKDGQWKFASLEMNTVYKRMTNTVQ